MKKKITALVMAAAMCLSVAACGSDNGGSGDTAKDTYTVGICSSFSTMLSTRQRRVSGTL